MLAPQALDLCFELFYAVLEPQMILLKLIIEHLVHLVLILAEFHELLHLFDILVDLVIQFC